MHGRSVLLALGIVLAALVASLALLSEDVGTRGAMDNRQLPPARPLPTPVALDATPAEARTPSPRSARELPDGVWIRGRIRTPEGVSTSFPAEVVARVLSLEDDPGFIAPVGADGTFLVVFPADADDGWLELRSPVLYLDEQVDVDLSEPPAEIVLEPRVGGRVLGRLVASPPSSVVEPAGTRVELLTTRKGGSPQTVHRTATVDESATFEIDALPPCDDYAVSVNSTGFVPVQRLLSVSPGSTTEIAIDLHACVRVLGHVKDDQGAPSSEAWVSSVRAGDPPYARRMTTAIRTAADGSFDLGSVRPGPLTVFVQASKELPEWIELGSFGDGAVVSGVEIQLRTARVTGVVQWPDGTPADACSVHLSPEFLFGPRYGRAPEAEFQTSRGAEFEFVVGSEGPFHLYAVASSPGAAGEIAGRSPPTTGAVMLDGVRPGNARITVILEPSHTVRGSVVDDLGQPVSSFAVRAVPWTSSGIARYTDQVSARYRREDGEFATDGLARGVWKFTPVLLGYEGLTSEPIEVPRAAPIVLVAPRRVDLSGVVLDPFGAPLALADVTSSSGLSTTSDRSGRFRLGYSPPGATEVIASSTEWACSEPLRFDAKPGEKKKDLELRLRRGGRITGEVFDESGLEASNRQVSIRGESGRLFPSPTSNAGGRFESCVLPPGGYRLSLESRQGGVLLPEPESPPPELSVEVVEGGVASVVIGRR